MREPEMRLPLLIKTLHPADQIIQSLHKFVLFSVLLRVKLIFLKLREGVTGHFQHEE